MDIKLQDFECKTFIKESISQNYIIQYNPHYTFVSTYLSNAVFILKKPQRQFIMIRGVEMHTYIR